MKNFTFNQFTFLVFTLCVGFLGYSQNNSTLERFYIKLDRTLDFNSPKDVISKFETLQTLNSETNFTIKNAFGFSKEQIENLTRVSKDNFTLKNTYCIEVHLNETESNSFLNTLKQLKQVVYAYKGNTTPIIPPHDISPTTTNFEANQGYIESNPGLNIRYAWNNNTNGLGINIKAVEYGLNVAHEELDHQNASIAPGATINPSATTAYTEHGSAVGGIVFADKGTYGISGLAYNANEYVLYPEWTVEYGYNRVLATSNAIANSNAGDIIIFEMQTGGQNGEFVLAEYEQAIWDLTKAATDAGIIIVAAAGNGNENLDDAFYNSYNARGDSGAIIIGAGTSNVNHNKMSFSTYGSRVNVQGWGENVYASANYGSSIVFGGDFNQSYYPFFSGTSSATAILGGFTAVLQSYYLAQTGNYMTPLAIRDLMINTGIAQGTGGHIGPLPNMEAAILSINNTLGLSNFKNNAKFTIYPNPASDFILVTSKSTLDLNISIYTVLGKKVLSSKTYKNNQKIDISSLSKGIYLVTIESNHTKTTKKLIIN